MSSCISSTILQDHENRQHFPCSEIADTSIYEPYGTVRTPARHHSGTKDNSTDDEQQLIAADAGAALALVESFFAGKANTEKALVPVHSTLSILQFIKEKQTKVIK